jgi:hypothetical protein
MVVDDALAAVIVSTVLTGGVVIVTVAKMFFGRRPPETQIAPSHLAEIHVQLRHLSESMDAIAIEVERISENQRFTTKVLAERAAAQESPRLPAKSITPH